VIVILDQISMTSSGKGRLLQEAGICLAVHRTQEFNPYTMSLMHHKFLIFRCNKQKRAWLWTGSWNCTVRASQANDENVLVVDDQNIVQKYLDYFTVLHSKLL
jgi:phosphatidylserine/phosphatidylglycerophosphate/cardiolipin synthase-like enzyme